MKVSIALFAIFIMLSSVVSRPNKCSCKTFVVFFKNGKQVYKETIEPSNQFWLSQEVDLKLRTNGKVVKYDSSITYSKQNW